MARSRCRLPAALAALALTGASCSCERRAPAPAPVTTEAAPPLRVDAPRDPIADALAEADRLAAAGKLPEATERLEALLAEHEGAPLVSRRLAVLYNQLAVGHANAGRYADADAASARALELAPHDAVLKKNRASILFSLANETQNPKAKRSLLEDALSLDEAHLPALLAAAKGAYDDNRLEEARALYARAKELRPDDEALARRLERVSQQADVEGSFQGARDTHFEVRFEGYAQERLAWTTLRLLEEAWFGVGERLGLYPEEVISVVVYTGDQYRRATGMPDWSGGAFDGKIRVREGDLLDQDGRLKDLLWHEYVHALLHEKVRRPIPAWLHEGLAQVLEPGRDDRHARVLESAPMLLAIGELEAPFVRIQDPRQVTLAYAQSLSLVAHLAGKQGTYGLGRLLAALDEGKPLDAALQEIYFLDLAGLEAEWLDTLAR